MNLIEVGYLQSQDQFERNQGQIQRFELLYTLMKQAKDVVMARRDYFGVEEIESAGQSGCYKIQNLTSSGSRGEHECGIGECSTRTSGDYALYHEGILFYFPAGILHYMKVHNYSPPREFVDAIVAIGSEKNVSGEPLPASFDRMIIM